MGQTVNLMVLTLGRGGGGGVGQERELGVLQEARVNGQLQGLSCQQAEEARVNGQLHGEWATAGAELSAGRGGDGTNKLWATKGR